MIVTTILCKMVLISGCYDARKALDKAQRKDPKEVAKFTREKFPCIETKSDTTISYMDSIIFCAIFIFVLFNPPLTAMLLR